MALLDNVKAALRITTTAFDGVEITPIINACKLDLGLAGVNIITESDPMVERAAVLYAKAHFGADENSEKYLQLYESQKRLLALASDYNAYKITFTVKHLTAAVRNAAVTIGNETVYTNSLGVAEFYVYAKADYDYTVSAAEYSPIVGSVYVDAAKAVAVAI